MECGPVIWVARRPGRAHSAAKIFLNNSFPITFNRESNRPTRRLPPTPGAPPPIIAAPPPKLADKPSGGRKFLAFLLSLFLGLFVASGLFSVLDDSCVLMWGLHAFTVLSGIFTLFAMLMALLVYVLLGVIPAIPKRIVLPVLAFIALSLLATLPATIYFYKWILQYDLICSCAVVVFGLGLIFRLQRGRTAHWPLVAVEQLGTRPFRWRNLVVFLLLNIFVLLPVVVIYVGGCANLAVTRFSKGFVSFRPAGVILQARKYTRDDGKTILLFPMSHIAESDFYRNVAQSVSTNSVVLLEGVTDEKNLLPQGISYNRAAKALHLSEQHEDFNLKQGQLVRADVDVSAFSSNTLALLRIVMRMHTEGLNAYTLPALLEYTPTETDEEQLFDDLLVNRNAHLLQELRTRLTTSNDFIIPWGAAHMPGLAAGIQQDGFHLVGTRNFVSIRFGGKAGDGNDPGRNETAN